VVEKDQPGTLWIVATPLGNAQDLSPRAREVLAGACLVLCEDTRRAARLFATQGLPKARFLSLFEHNEAGRVPQVLELLAQGQSPALISDAGTPVLSDPGFRLVRACRQAGYQVSPVPGPSAVMAALMAAGIAPHPFVFLGFLPRKPGDIRKLFERFAAPGCSLVFFERKDRLAKSLGLAREVLGERECAVAREMTKTHEEFLLGTLSDFADKDLELLGEITVVLGPAGQAPVPAGDVSQVMAQEILAGGKPRDIARRAAARLPGQTAKDLYELVLASRAGKT
jgi:16S rRNA (cytidine1402-2'-O)-methyltransferase